MSKNGSGTVQVRFYMELVSFFFSFISLFVGILFWGSFLTVEWNLVSYGSVVWCLELMFDGIGLIFLSVVMVITGCVLRFSKFYMVGEINFNRFYCVLGLFVLSMVALLVIPNLLGLMIGWDGLGVTSYLLVIHYPCSSSLSAGMLTFLTNRLGDAFLMSCLLLVGVSAGDWFLLFDYEILGFLMVVGAMTKSAQYPFSVWLPAAMAAPTPVSSLVHSSTLVTAGVFLLIRCYGSLGDFSLTVLYWSSLLTLVISGCSACFEFDLKKVVALSTLSHVSIMMFSLSIGLPELSFFHLMCHAVSKAMLFMCVGFMLMEGSQDIRRLGWDYSGVFWLKSYFFVSCFSLCGISFFSGYYSKDLILEGLIGSFSSVFGFLMFFTGVIFSSLYSIRLMYYGLFSGSLFGWMGLDAGCFEGKSMCVHSCCFPLFVCSVFLGGAGYMVLERMPCIIPGDWLKSLIISIPFTGVFIFFLVISIGLGAYKSMIEKSYVDILGRIQLFSFFDELGFLDRLSGQTLVKPVFVFGDMCCGYLDQGWLELIGPSGLGAFSVSYLKSNSDSKISWFSSSFLWYTITVIVLGFASV
nr:NADH dehydrogenase subunit 5 [Propeamussium sp. mt1]